MQPTPRVPHGNEHSKLKRARGEYVWVVAGDSERPTARNAVEAAALPHGAVSTGAIEWGKM